MVILSDAKSVLQTLENPKSLELDSLRESLVRLNKKTEMMILQWIPGHCDLPGNDKADDLAKEGAAMEQQIEAITYGEAKTMIKSQALKIWNDKHPQYNSKDPIYKLDRNGQTCIFRLRTGHNRLKQHMFKTFKVGQSGLCSCGESPETTEHVLQNCRLLDSLRNEVWDTETALNTKLYGRA